MSPTPVLPQQSFHSHGLDSQRLNVQNSLHQSSDHNSKAQAVKLTLNQVDFFYGSRQSLFKINMDILQNQVTSFICRPAVGNLPCCAASIGSTT